MKALIYVQHLLGTGHVVRAAAVARELHVRGHTVTLVSGNTIPETLDLGGLDVSLLPPVRARDATFSELIDQDGHVIDDAWRDSRVERLLATFEAVEPEILVTETFPLGRRQFAFELFPILDAARARPRSPLIACSVRDILVRKDDPRKERWMADIVDAYYDLVLVHADPSLVRLEDSFPFSGQIAQVTRYTGYVHEQREAALPSPDGDGEVIVSAGGGPVGIQLLETAIAARDRSTHAGAASWRLLVGHSHSDAVFDSLKEQAGDGIIVERARPDFQALLSRSLLSISQAGYNTALDVVAAGCPAVLVPFEEEDESEQTLRAALLKDRGLCQVVREARLSPKRLAKAIDKALVRRAELEGPEMAAGLALSMDGAAAAADILTQEAERRFG